MSSLLPCLSFALVVLDVMRDAVFGVKMMHVSVGVCVCCFLIRACYVFWLSLRVLSVALMFVPYY